MGNKARIRALASGLLLATAASAHVPDGSGNALQLYSYRLSNPADKPVINGTILSKTAGSSSGTETPEEWKEAYARAITLSDNTTAHIFLMNDDDSLYVAVLRPDNNNGDGIGTFLYFDQGPGGQGDHDGQLTGGSSTIRNEAGYGILRTSGTFNKQDLSWNGTSWTADADGSSDFNGAASILGSSTKVQAFEFAIPLDDGKAFSSGSADLRVNSLRQELGMFIRISRGGSDCDSCYWDKTNGKAGDPTSGVGWADVRLNVSRNFTTFYSTFAKNGNPTVDGSLNEDAWRGAYRRDINLTNFNGGVLPATLYSVQNPTDKTIYIGVRVQDSVSNAADSLQIYFEEKAGDNTTARDYLLESGAEDAVSAKGATAHDMNWSGSAWAADAEAADAHQAVGAFAAGAHQYEMRVPYQAGAEDIGVTDNGFPGFLIRYHDADRSAGSQEFYWEYTVNSDAVRVNQQATPAIFVTAGWANFQLGAPYTQVVFPQDSAALEGTVNLRLYAEDKDGVGGVDSVKFYRAADTTSKTKLNRIANTGEWSGAWDVSGLTNGIDTLVFRAFDNNGVYVDRLVPIVIANGATAVAPPTITLTSPLPGSPVSGTVNLQFTASGGGGTIRRAYVVVDGADTVATSGAAVHAWNTVPLADGFHTVQLLVYNTNGASAHTSVVTFQVANAPGIAWLSPAGGSTVTGRLILNYDATARGAATIASDSLLVDGAAFAALRIPDGPDTLDVSALPEGNHTFQIKATDNAGKTGLSSPVSLRLQNGPWISLISPQGGSQVSGRMALTYHDSAAAPATVVSDSLLWDGKALQGLSLSGQDTLNTTAFEDGEHSLQLKATDSKGRVGLSSPVTLLLRNRPSALIDSSLADSTVSGRLVVRFRMSAVSPATLSKKEIALDGGPWRSVGGDSTDTVDTRALSEGAHTVQVKATDSRGKSVLSRLVKFNVKNAPTVTILSPAVDAFVKGMVTVRFKATAVAPDSIKQTQISIGGGEWESTPTDTSFNLDTRKFKDGDLLIQIRAVDGHGKADTTLAREIVVDNSAPKISYPQVAYGAWEQGRAGARLVATAQGLDKVSGMDKDSALVLTSPGLAHGAPILLKDDGKAPDAAAGDNVYSVYLVVDTDTGSTLPYSLRGRDALGNDTVLVGAIALDNRPPTAALKLDPALPKAGGTVYASRAIIKGTFADSAGSGVAAATLVVRNDSGLHVMNSPVALPSAAGDFSRVVPLVPGANHVMLIVVDKAGNADTATATLTYEVAKATGLVGSDGGGISAPSGAAVRIPAGALPGTREITILPGDPAAEAKPSDPALTLLGVPQEFGPDHTVFRKPVTVTLVYTDLDLDTDQDGKPDIRPEDLNVVFWDGRAWVRAGEIKLDKSTHTISAEVNHFTLYDLAKHMAAAPASLAAFWETNPVRQGSGGVFRAKLPDAGQVSLAILDMAGDLVNTIVPGGTHRPAGESSWIWDGSNVKGRFAGAGLYVYVFRYKSDAGGAATVIRKPVGLVGR